jgi:hypothetical protein
MTVTVNRANVIPLPPASSIKPRARRWPRAALYVSVAVAIAAVGILIDDAIAPGDLVVGAPGAPQTVTTADPPADVTVKIAPQRDEQGAQSAAAGGPAPPIGTAELAGQLAVAHRQMDAFALTTPPGDNALETLQRILAVMPGQPDAVRGIRDIAGKYAFLATQAEQRGDSGLAMRHVQRGLKLAPDHPDLLALQRKLAASAQSARQPKAASDAGIELVRPAGSTK